MNVFRTCREATSLLIAREDRKLGWRERVALRTHLLVCGMCKRYARQLKWMRRAFRAWRDQPPVD